MIFHVNHVMELKITAQIVISIEHFYKQITTFNNVNVNKVFIIK